MDIKNIDLSLFLPQKHVSEGKRFLLSPTKSLVCGRKIYTFNSSRYFGIINLTDIEHMGKLAQEMNSVCTKHGRIL